MYINSLSKKVCKIKILSFNYFHATKTLLKSYIQNVTGACEKLSVWAQMTPSYIFTNIFSSECVIMFL